MRYAIWSFKILVQAKIAPSLSSGTAGPRTLPGSRRSRRLSPIRPTRCPSRPRLPTVTAASRRRDAVEAPSSAPKEPITQGTGQSGLAGGGSTKDPVSQMCQVAVQEGGHPFV